jgi:hypothetical protein
MELLEEEIMRNRNCWKTMVGNKELLAEEKRRNLEPEFFCKKKIGGTGNL